MKVHSSWAQPSPSTLNKYSLSSGDKNQLDSQSCFLLEQLLPEPAINVLVPGMVSQRLLLILCANSCLTSTAFAADLSFCIDN